MQTNREAASGRAWEDGKSPFLAMTSNQRCLCHGVALCLLLTRPFSQLESAANEKRREIIIIIFFYVLALNPIHSPFPVVFLELLVLTSCVTYGSTLG